MSRTGNPLVRKLQLYVQLSADDKRAVETMSSARVRTIQARSDLISEGDRPNYVNLFLSGWACRYKVLEDGRRQIISYFLPGDLCDHNIFVLRTMDHSIGTVTETTIAEIDRERLEAITLRHPRVTQALWWETLVNSAIQREWAVSLGQRDAVERIGHLLCELYMRLESVGLAEKGTCEFPLTQVELAETTGLSAVHVNRSLQELRAANLIVLKGRVLTIPSLKSLQAASLFNDNYLHLGREGRQLDSNED